MVDKKITDIPDMAPPHGIVVSSLQEKIKEKIVLKVKCYYNSAW